MRPFLQGGDLGGRGVHFFEAVPDQGRAGIELVLLDEVGVAGVSWGNFAADFVEVAVELLVNRDAHESRDADQGSAEDAPKKRELVFAFTAGGRINAGLTRPQSFR